MKLFYQIAIVLLCLGFASPLLAKTATVTYTYNGQPTDQVGILVSTVADFTQALASGATVTGAIDTDKDGTVEIGGLVPGNTYYFAAVAWDSNNNRTDFSPTLSADIPIDPPFVFEQYPPIEIEGKTVTFSITVK